jgi:DNA-binding NtrC family response regulator
VATPRLFYLQLHGHVFCLFLPGERFALNEETGVPASELIRVLLVDDSLEFRRSLTKIFEKAGFQVRAVDNGGRASALLQKEFFPLIITDLRMAGKSGLELLREAKAESPDSKVIIVTAFGDEEECRQALAAGASAYLFKPVKRKAIIEAARQALEGI